MSQDILNQKNMLSSFENVTSGSQIIHTQTLKTENNSLRIQDFLPLAKGPTPDYMDELKPDMFS